MKIQFLKRCPAALLLLASVFCVSACSQSATTQSATTQSATTQSATTQSTGLATHTVVAVRGSGATVGKGAFIFNNWAGPDLKIWTYIPDGATPDSAIVFILHGVNRDGERYRNEWVRFAKAGRFILVVPEFPKKHFPGAYGYNFGNIMTRRGREAIPRAHWAFSAIEPIFDRVKERTGNRSDAYGLYGHSAGAQFVHRFVYFMPDARLTRAVAANSGWYTMPTLDTAFPYGLAGVGIGPGDLDKALSARLLILLGTKDTNPSHRWLRRTPQANAQGPHRFARGQNFMAAARNKAMQNGAPFGWILRYAPGVGHKNAAMARFAAPYLAGSQKN